MSDGSGQVVDHELEDWFDFFFIVPRVVSQGSILHLLTELEIYREV